MNKYTLLFCGLYLFAAQHLFAQTKENSDFNIWNLQKDSGAFVFTNKAYLRSGAGIQNPIIDSLSLGSSVTVRQQTEIFETARAIYAPWMKVSVSVNGVSKEGFIWLGNLALRKQSFAGTDYFYGIERVIKEKADDLDYYKFIIQLKAVGADRNIIDMKEFKADGGESASFNEIKSLGNTRLENLKDVIRISFGGEACGIPTNYYYFGFTGDKLLPLPGKYSVGDAGVFYHNETLLFPNEKGGQPGKIIKLIEEEEVPEAEMDKDNPKTKKTNSKETYIWNGQAAIKQKK